MTRAEIIAAMARKMSASKAWPAVFAAGTAEVLAEAAFEAHPAAGVKTALLDIMGHLGAAKVQRAPADDTIIAEHIEAALTSAQTAYRELGLG